MQQFLSSVLDFLAQFGGGRGEPENSVVRFGLAAFFWGVLLAVAWSRQWRRERSRERLLVWGFALGLARESFMLLAFFLQDLGLVDPDRVHVVFPPLEHALSLAAIVVVAAAFLSYILDRTPLASRYLAIGLGAVAACYLATFWWWARHITAYPDSFFSRVWCDWLFRLTGCGLISIPMVFLLRKGGWVRNSVFLALLFFFMDDFLKVIDMALLNKYEAIFTPIRHNFHIWAIPILGYVYWREETGARRELEREILEIGDREQRRTGRDLHDGLIQQLTGIALLSELLAGKLKSQAIPQAADAEELQHLLRDAIEQGRGLTRGLYPVDLQQAGLTLALHELAHNSEKLFHVPCTFICRAECGVLDVEFATHVYRIVQEAVSNALKHGKPQSVTIDVSAAKERCCVRVRDDGVGIPGEALDESGRHKVGGGMGLRTMSYRASMIDADLRIQRQRRGGTEVSFTFRLPQAARRSETERDGETP